MPKSKKNKPEKVIHPYSRKAAKEERKILHKYRIEQGRHERSSKLDILAEKLRWFHERLDDRISYTKADLLELVDEFRHRFDEELNQISIVHSVGARKTNKQHAPRLAAIKFTMEAEKSEFESNGIEVPDLVNKDNLFKFRLWNGEMKFAQNFKMKKITSLDQENELELAQKTLSTADEITAAPASTSDLAYF